MSNQHTPAHRTAIGTSTRLLRLLSLLGLQPSWTADELARRLNVTDRTVRRDITRLRELGYDVESDPGRWGGYRLTPAAKQIPLLLDDDESFAIAVALREVTQTGVLADGQAALSAFLKLKQLLPTRVACQLGAMDGVFEHLPRTKVRSQPTGLLASLATACWRSMRLRLSYLGSNGVNSTHSVDPYRMVFTGDRWYLVGHDVERAAWRTFRADSVVCAESTGRVVRHQELPNATRLVAESLVGDNPLHALVRLLIPSDEAMRAVPPAEGVHWRDGTDTTVVEFCGPDAEALADRLLRLGVPLVVLSPPEVREAVQRRALLLAASNSAKPVR